MKLDIKSFLSSLFHTLLLDFIPIRRRYFSTLAWFPEDIFFLSILMVGGEALSCPNCKHSLFRIRYFETSVSQGNTSGAANDMFSVKYLFGEA